MSETTTEQLAEIEGQAQYILPEGWQVVPSGEPLRGGDEYHEGLDRYIRPIEPESEPEPQPEPAAYYPPEGWRLVPIGETLQKGDIWVRPSDGRRFPTKRVGSIVRANQRYIRRIEQPEPVQVREGRWKTRGGDIRNVTPTPASEGREERWPWRDTAYDQTWTPDGRYSRRGESPLDLVKYLGPIEPEAQPEPESEPEPEPQQVNDWPSVRDLRSEVSHVQRLLGTEKRRVVELEQLVTSLRTINEGAEKAVDAAGTENTALRNQLAVVKAQLTTAAAVCQQLQIELDAAQQVPADSPELRQLRADLEQMTLGRDTYRDGYDRVLSDLVTARETAKAEAVEAIAEWLEPIRLVDHPNLANETLQHLPQIMRHLTGLDSHAID